MPAKRVYLSLGTNLGEREANLEQALGLLQAERFVITRRSSLYETEPRDFVQQPWFLNMAVEGETSCFPLQLLAILLRIERQMGRARRSRVKGPRPIDMDILLYGSAVMDTEQLKIPHPRMLERRFVLEPLLEIAPDLRDPTTGKALSSYLRKVADQKVSRVDRDFTAKPEIF